MNNNFIMFIIGIGGLHIGLASFTALMVWMGQRLRNFGLIIAKTGIAPTDSWSRNNPPYNTSVPKIWGLFYVLCGSIGFLFAAFAIGTLVTVDIVIIWRILKH